MTAFFYFCAVVLLGVAFALMRNSAAHSVRIDFIYSPDFPLAYDRLPSYDAMVFHPKYWRLWTTAHWRAWLARQPVGVAA